MSALTHAFHEALAHQAAAALVDVVASSPNVTVAELRSLVAENPGLAALTLGELVANVGGGRGRAKRAPKVPGRKRGRPRKDAAATPAAKPKKGAGRGRDLSSGAARDKLDAEVFAAIREAGDWVGANDLRGTVGRVDATQFRNSVNRLIELGRVVYKGKARWTVYRAA